MRRTVNLRCSNRTCARSQLSRFPSPASAVWSATRPRWCCSRALHRRSARAMGPGRIVVGRDTRTSGEMVRQAVIGAGSRLATGSRHRRVSRAYRAAGRSPPRRAGGNRNHGQPQPRGVERAEVHRPDALFLSGARGRELLDPYHQGEYRRGERQRDATDREPARGVGRAPARGGDAVGVLRHQGRRLRVALDSCNGAGSIVAPPDRDARRRCGTIHTTPQRSSPSAEPTPAKFCSALGDPPRSSRADVGFRAGTARPRTVLAHPAPKEETHRRGVTPQLAVQRVRVRHTRPGCHESLDAGIALEAVAARAGCTVVRTAVGEANVAEGMQRRARRDWGRGKRRRHLSGDQTSLGATASSGSR